MNIDVVIHRAEGVVGLYLSRLPTLVWIIHLIYWTFPNAKGSKR